jgi:hypothetical protein
MAVNWEDRDHWGDPATCVHIGTYVTDDHDRAEAAAERRFA